MYEKEFIESLLDIGYELLIEPSGEGQIVLVNPERKETATLLINKWTEEQWEDSFKDEY